MDGWGGENLEMSFRIWQCKLKLTNIVMITNSANFSLRWRYIRDNTVLSSGTYISRLPPLFVSYVIFSEISFIYSNIFRFPNDRDTHGLNTVRMAKVWMDEYIDLFFLNRPDLKVLN